LVERFEADPRYTRIDEVMVHRNGARAVRGNAVVDSLALEARALPLHRIYLREDAKEIAILLQFAPGSTGHPGVVHGGVTAMLFDNAMGWMAAISKLRDSDQCVASDRVSA